VRCDFRMTGTTGTGRAPQPSSAGAYSSAQPSANVGMISTENAIALSLNTTMATSGLSCAIHCLERSNPENTRCQIMLFSLAEVEGGRR
jgi:hypothetical protein